MKNPRYIVEPVDNHWEVWETLDSGTRVLVCVLHNEHGAQEAANLLNRVYERRRPIDRPNAENPFPRGRWEPCEHDWRPVQSNGDLVLYRCRNCRLEELE